MSTPITLSQLTALAAQLPPAERRALAETILRELQAPSQPRRRFWKEIRGSFPSLLCGDDAQAWVSRSRREADANREVQPGAPG